MNSDGFLANPTTSDDYPFVPATEDLLDLQCSGIN